MILRSALCAMCLAGLVGSGLAQAGTNDILIGLDNKITYGPEGTTNGAPGNDAVLVVDVSNPAKPKIRASLTLANSLLGPPTKPADHTRRQAGPGRQFRGSRPGGQLMEIGPG
jgi:hypothetical protein